MDKRTIMIVGLLCSLGAGCQATAGGNVGHVHSFPVAAQEASWIRNGEPIVFEEEDWYPTDNMEVFQDVEMLLMGEQQGVQFFIDRTDVRPFNRLYTKFSRNRFRVFEKGARE